MNLPVWAVEINRFRIAAFWKWGNFFFPPIFFIPSSFHTSISVLHFLFPILFFFFGNIHLLLAIYYKRWCLIILPSVSEVCSVANLLPTPTPARYQYHYHVPTRNIISNSMKMLIDWNSWRNDYQDMEFHQLKNFWW